MRLLAAALLVCFFFTATLHAQTPAAITTDPVPDKAHPATIETFQLPSHGSQLNAFLYIAAGATPHPTVLLLHGFPGNERNLDLATDHSYSDEPDVLKQIHNRGSSTGSCACLA